MKTIVDLGLFRLALSKHRHGIGSRLAMRECRRRRAPWTSALQILIEYLQHTGSIVVP